jgi:chemotaxis protein CheX
MTLPASLDLTLADTLHHSLLERIANERPLAIDGSEVERVSTPCVQLLVAASASARAHGLPFRIVSASQILSDAARDLGLSRALGLEDVG